MNFDNILSFVVVKCKFNNFYVSHSTDIDKEITWIEIFQLSEKVSTPEVELRTSGLIC